jgi:hypothetical protein
MGATGAGPPTAEVLARLPVSEAAQWLLRWACDEGRLAAVWADHRGRCYDRCIAFPTLTRLVAEALVQYRGSGRRAFEKNIAADRLDASVAAAFGKLGRLPLAVSQAFLESTTAALTEVVVPTGSGGPPAGLGALWPVVIDGKTIKRVAKRLKPLRGVGGGLVGAKALVATDGRTGLAVALEADPDGDGSENLLVPGLLQRVRRRVAGPRLFIGDRSFGNLVQAEQFTADGDHFLVRLHSNCRFDADPGRPTRTGTDPQGRPVVEAWGILGGPGNRRRRPARRIHLHRGPGEGDIVLVTDLNDAAEYPASDLLQAYRDRHGIEGVFQKTTEVFGLERLIGGSPQAGVFQFAFCLLLYNIVRTLLGYVAEVRGQPVGTLSAEKFYDDARRQLIAWHVVFTPEQTDDYYRALMDRPGLVRHLRALIAGAWCPTWVKTKPQPNRRVAHPPHARSHASVHRLLTAARTQPTAAQPRPGNTQRC